ncbi:cytochrome P450 [Streptomyces olivaceoviridis]|uniref:cytochrome P450 n=1 Tax=Streptomyces olivaceoviridis TaxID=1921 RepID=UPI0036BF106B
MQPELQETLHEDPGLVPAAVEETLRLWTPVDHGTRVTTRAVPLGGTEIPAGARVVLLTGAANRDPQVFPDPDTFRLDRGVNRHLTFGHGIHFPYAHTSALYDVTSGSNGSCGGSYLCTGTTGYDGPTGLGVPNGSAAFTG